MEAPSWLVLLPQNHLLIGYPLQVEGYAGANVLRRSAGRVSSLELAGRVQTQPVTAQSAAVLWLARLCYFNRLHFHPENLQ